MKDPLKGALIGFRVWGASDSGFEDSGLGFRILGFKVLGLGCGISRSGSLKKVPL